MLENFRLKVFRTVAETRSFRQAADALYLSQPAVTQQIKALEDQLGTLLFDRSSRQVSLTNAGRILLSYADKSNALLLKAEEKLAASNGELRGNVTVGASTTIAQYVLPELLAEFARLHPAVTLQIDVANTEAVVRSLIEQRTALGLIEGPAHSNDVGREPWIEDELVLVVPRNHEWAGVPEITVGHLADAPLLMRELGSGSREVLEKALKGAGANLKHKRFAMELNSTEALLSCIEAGFGVGFVSRYALKRQLKLGTLAIVPVKGLRVVRTFLLITPRNPGMQGTAASLCRFLREYRERRALPEHARRNR